MREKKTTKGAERRKKKKERVNHRTEGTKRNNKQRKPTLQKNDVNGRFAVTPVNEQTWRQWRCGFEDNISNIINQGVGGASR